MGPAARANASPKRQLSSGQFGPRVPIPLVEGAGPGERLFVCRDLTPSRPAWLCTGSRSISTPDNYIDGRPFLFSPRSSCELISRGGGITSHSLAGETAALLNGFLPITTLLRCADKNQRGSGS
ncbi:hypothetical protein SKAU_G00125210 [Synaphobranchus kaupii]|uniref:Uncharacterized protein n=1 Tax=Synaphobranchus kaupii TaxID=118154 RepID=A0A9Q1FPZ7_SYNKA|nr:hypothetical protein SKAU_G00125210 [Synaphobranchus kaupii]